MVTLLSLFIIVSSFKLLDDTKTLREGIRCGDSCWTLRLSTNKQMAFATCDVRTNVKCSLMIGNKPKNLPGPWVGHVNVDIPIMVLFRREQKPKDGKQPCIV